MRAVAELERDLLRTLLRTSLSGPAVALWCTLWLFEPNERINQCNFGEKRKLSVRLWGERRAVGATARAMLGLLVSMASESNAK